MAAARRVKSHRGTDAGTYLSPSVPSGVGVTEVPIVTATPASLEGLGCLLSDPDEFTTANGRFEIVPWPKPGWRNLDPATGTEAGTTEGAFELYWQDGNLHGENLALSTTANKYVLGLGALPEQDPAVPLGQHLYVWYADYHPDGGQLFFSRSSPFVANLAPPVGDDVRPEHFTAFYFEAGTGLYIHPSVWHNAVYVLPEYAPTHVITRQGRVHARISVRWVEEFNTLLRVPLRLPE